MQRRGLKKSSRIAALRYRFTMTCCGREHSWPGLPADPKKTAYICRECKKEMHVTTEEVRTREECELIVLHEHRFDDKCPDCGAKGDHHVRRHDHEDAWFLHCRVCGTELREILEEELS